MSIFIGLQYWKSYSSFYFKLCFSAYLRSSKCLSLSQILRWMMRLMWILKSYKCYPTGFKLRFIDFNFAFSIYYQYKSILSIRQYSYDNSYRSKITYITSFLKEVSKYFLQNRYLTMLLINKACSFKGMPSKD